jgi:hypothetical protein
MPSKHKKTKKINQLKLKEKTSAEVKISNIYESDSETMTHLKYNIIRKKNIPVNNSYPVGILGQVYPAQMNIHPDVNKYFQNNNYTYSVQMNKPVLTYDNFITQNTLKNMTSQEHKYYQQFQQQTYNFNGNYDVVNKKPTVLAIQAKLQYPSFYTGPVVGEINGQTGYTPQPTQSSQPIINVNPNTFGPNGGTVQIYGNSPAYTGIQAKTSPGQNAIANINTQQTKANNANINNPAYFNYGQYYY